MRQWGMIPHWEVEICCWSSISGNFVILIAFTSGDVWDLIRHGTDPKLRAHFLLVRLAGHEEYHAHALRKFRKFRENSGCWFVSGSAGPGGGWGGVWVDGGPAGEIRLHPLTAHLQQLLPWDISTFPSNLRYLFAKLPVTNPPFQRKQTASFFETKGN